MSWPPASPRDGAHAEWFYGFRLAILTDLGSRIVRSWAIVPAAVNEREVALGLVEGLDWLVGLLCDKGFNGAPFAAELAELGIAVLIPPTKAQRKKMPKMLPGGHREVAQPGRDLLRGDH